MALGLTLLLGTGSGTDASSYNTASVTIVEDRIYRLTVITPNAASTTPVKPTVTGAGQTWTEANDNLYDNDGAQRRRITDFICKGGAGGGSGALTIDYGGVSQSGSTWLLVEITGADLTGTNGAGAFRNWTNGGHPTNNVSSLTITLPALLSADNAGLGVFSKQSVAEAFTPGSGFTELADFSVANPSVQSQSEWKLNETAVSVSWTTATIAGGVAVEVIAAGAGGQTISPTGAVTPTGSLAHKVAKALAGTITPSGVLATRITKSLVGTVTPAGVLALLRTQRASLAGQVAPSGELRLKIAKALAGTVTPSGEITRKAGKLLLGTITPTGELILPVGDKLLQGTIAPTGALRLKLSKSLGGTITPTGSLGKAYLLTPQTPDAFVLTPISPSAL